MLVTITKVVLLVLGTVFALNAAGNKDDRIRNLCVTLSFFMFILLVITLKIL